MLNIADNAKYSMYIQHLYLTVTFCHGLCTILTVPWILLAFLAITFCMIVSIILNLLSNCKHAGLLSTFTSTLKTDLTHKVYDEEHM